SCEGRGARQNDSRDYAHGDGGSSYGGKHAEVDSSGNSGTADADVRTISAVDSLGFERADSEHFSRYAQPRPGLG
ncbi:MAG: hypothetical protein M3R43_06185, partial [Acidobacteriota bacterium]|nr:hypothetical protein [Acidobacteriota bacterium]